MAHRSALRSAFHVVLISAAAGAAVVAGILIAGSLGFDRAIMVLSYLNLPSGSVLMPILQDLAPDFVDGGESGMLAIAFCAWVQVSVIAAAVIGIGYWLATGAFYDHPRK